MHVKIIKEDSINLFLISNLFLKLKVLGFISWNSENFERYHTMRRSEPKV